jgi:hypothetical protein
MEPLSHLRAAVAVAISGSSTGASRVRPSLTASVSISEAAVATLSRSRNISPRVLSPEIYGVLRATIPVKSLTQNERFVPQALLARLKGTRMAAVQSVETRFQLEGIRMKNPLDSLWGTVISGLVLTLILYNIVKYTLQ